MRRLILAFVLGTALIATATAQDLAPNETPGVEAPAPVTAPDPSEASGAIRKITAQAFVARVSAMNERELALARMAVEKSSNAGVKKLAERIVADHEAMARALTAAAARQPTTPDATGATGAGDTDATGADDAETLAALGRAEGADFDRMFLEAQASAHTEAIRLFTEFSEAGDDPALRDFAVGTLPTLQEHQQAVAELQKST